MTVVGADERRICADAFGDARKIVVAGDDEEFVPDARSANSRAGFMARCAPSPADQERRPDKRAKMVE
jgi:hypothetical protein